jgi:glycosyltransferase involved in cell wall biosynthesis
MLARVQAAADEAPESVRYIGRLDQAVLAAVYKQADVGVCAYGPQSNVGMPDKLYDYTTGGLAVVNSLPGEVEALIRDEGIGQQYRAGDAESLAAAIIALAADPDARVAMSRRSWSAASRFDQAVQYPALSAFLEEVVAPGSHPSVMAIAGEP